MRLGNCELLTALTRFHGDLAKVVNCRVCPECAPGQLFAPHCTHRMSPSPQICHFEEKFFFRVSFSLPCEETRLPNGFYPDWIFEQQKQGAAVGKSKNKVKAGHGTKPFDNLDVRLITYQLDGRTKLYNFTFPLCCSWRRFIINYFWALADLKVFFKSFVLALWNPASLHSSQPGRNLRLLNFQNPSTKLCFCH